jgi:hypothetical protein
VQVDPIKLTLKAPEIKQLKLSSDEPPSNFAFKFNLRRYNEDRGAAYVLGRRRLTVSKPALKLESPFGFRA